MIIYKSTTNRSISKFICDRCKVELGARYAIHIKEPNQRDPRKKWDLCEHCYKSLVRGIAKGK